MSESVAVERGTARGIVVHPEDSVAVVLRTVHPGERIEADTGGVTARETIPAGHKVALRALARGQRVMKYGERIGSATTDIAPGSHVHSHNLRTDLTDGGSYVYEPWTRGEPASPVRDGVTFDGYRRASGRVGTRNEVWIINTVGCVNSSAERIAREASAIIGERTNFDGVFSFSHPFGCSQLGDDLSDTRRVLAGLAQHPNAGGVLILGLGCENNQAKELLKEIGEGVPQSRLRVVLSQEVEDEVETGVRAVCELAAEMGRDHREPIDIAELCVGVKCGGSDGFSGLTANALVGGFTDELTRRGGTVLQTEVPEMFGAERGLMNRAADERVFEEVVGLIERFKKYFVDYGQPVYENPSPGNKEGGLTTLEEKSLGATQKGGRAIVTGTARYGHRADGPGLVLVESPGNDGVSSTAMTVAGATVLLFTTGRGTPLGFPAPTVKISSNTDLAQRKPMWIDFDAGRLVDPRVDRDRLAGELLRFVVEVASGRVRTRNETRGYREIAIWKRGVTL